MAHFPRRKKNWDEPTGGQIIWLESRVPGKLGWIHNGFPVKKMVEFGVTVSQRARGSPLGNVEGVEYEDVVVVLGQGDYVALAGDLQAAAPGHLDTHTIKIRFAFDQKQLLF